MFTYVRKAGTTDVSVVIRIIDSTDGTPETGVVWNTSGIDLEYRREGATSTDITEATLATLDAAHSDGGFLHIGNGYYRLDLPDAACAAGAVGVLVHGTVTGMVVIGCYIQLVTYDPFDSVRLGLTALPNAAADAAGGLPISDAGGLDMDAVKNNVATINGHITADYASTEKTCIDLLDDAAGGLADIHTDVAAVKTDTGAIKTKTDNLPTDPADESLIEAAITSAHSTTNGKIDAVDDFVDTEVAAILAVVDTEVAAIKAKTDNLPTDPADESLIEAAITSAHSTTNGKIDAVDDYIDTEIAAILADTNELQTDWHDGGRLDLILDAAGSAGDPWVTALPGAYGAGTAGKIIGDNINAPIGTVDTVVDAIKAKTDNLPTDPADESAIEAAITAAHSTTNGKIDVVDGNVDAILADIDGIPKNTALANFEFLMVDETDGKTAETGLSVTATRSIDGAAFAACANAVSEVAYGIYKINLAAADLNGDVITLRFTATGALDRLVTIKTNA